ncbi:MAG TPA: MarR family transcriptional regulator [Myxococcales bacterium]|nr:MarR family transcriptional regulator [Myxococcales bacterium]
MAGKASEDAAETLDAFRRLVRALRESSREAEKRAGISGAQLFVLQQLRHGETLSMTELARRTLTHPSSVSVVVARLFAAGLVSRERSAADARRVDLRLTRKGRTMVDKAPRMFQERLIAGVGELPPKQRRGLSAGLRALVTAMGLDTGEAHMLFEEHPPRRGGRRPAA